MPDSNPDAAERKPGAGVTAPEPQAPSCSVCTVLFPESLRRLLLELRRLTNHIFSLCPAPCLSIFLFFVPCILALFICLPCLRCVPIYVVHEYSFAY